MVALMLEPIHDWVDAPGVLVSWDPSPTTLAKVREAPASAAPASYQQAQHLRAYCEHAAQGTEMARLNIPAWNIAGKCDIGAMSHVINAYLRRHDTYHSWFQFDDDGQIIRRTIRNPGDIKFVPTEHGETTPADWRHHVLATPSPLQWDCFRFGIVQRSDHFTFYVSVDHLHADAMFMCAVFVEIHMMYTALARGGAPIRLPAAGSYADYCVRQHQYTSALTLASPQVRAWVDFANNNDATLPSFPLPLGDPSVPCAGALLTVELMDEQESRRFDSVCVEGGARFSAGVFACAALAERELTGSETYYVITPTTTRNTSADFMTTGWFTGVVPITVPLAAKSFRDIALAAQASFDSGIELANVPFDRVLELATSDLRLRKPRPGVPMLSYLEAGIPPLSPDFVSQWNELKGRIYSDVGAARQVGMWVNRSEQGTTITVAFPDNPIARESIVLYLDALKSECVRVARGRTVARPPVPVPTIARTRCAAVDVAAS
jgi:hypothetical protein